jgi:uncharacterized protein (TIGR03437 family)
MRDGRHNRLFLKTSVRCWAQYCKVSGCLYYKQQGEIVIKLRRTALAALAFAGVAGAQTISSTSAGNWGPIVAPDSIAAGFGSNLATQTTAATSLPLPTTLGGATLNVTDSAKGNEAAGFYMVSSGQVNFLVPSNAAVGLASLTYTASGGAQTPGTALLSNVAPAVFAANQNGTGAAVAQFLRVTTDNKSTVTDTFAGSSGSYTTNPYTLGSSTDKVYLVLYATGIRRHSLNPVQAKVGDTAVPVLYAGQVAAFAGLDQINIGPLPSSLSGTGKGDIAVQLTVDGVPANAVMINVQ